LTHMAAVFKTMLRHFLKGEQTLPETQIRHLMRKWGDALEEVNIRRIDMRKLRAYLPKEF
jgi:hypothetical protein